MAKGRMAVTIAAIKCKRPVTTNKTIPAKRRTKAKRFQNALRPSASRDLICFDSKKNPKLQNVHDSDAWISCARQQKVVNRKNKLRPTGKLEKTKRRPLERISRKMENET